MKCLALKPHFCKYCNQVIEKGKGCYVYFYYPQNPEENEFDTVYMCKQIRNIARIIEDFANYLKSN